MGRSVSIFFLCFALFLTEAKAELSSFVADAVQAAPGLETRRGKLYVSDLGTRFEFTAKNRKVVQIIQPSLGLFRLLFPATRTYFELKSPSSRLVKARRKKKPCQTTGSVICKRKGMVKSGAMTLEHWVVARAGEKSGVDIWWDPVRHMYIRQVFPDGRTMVARKVGTRQFEGRLVEQWKMTLRLAGGAEYYSYMLFAPDLGFPVMEQGSAGLVKELHNIRPYKVGPDMFEVPEGYRRAEPSGDLESLKR